MKLRRSWLLLVAIIATNSSWTDEKKSSIFFPKGWRLLTDQELQDSWRKKDPQRYTSIEGDFDGDKHIDVAKILIQEKDKQIGIFVWLLGPDKSPVKVHEDSPDSLQDMGIGLARPERLKTACGKGYFECTNEPPILDLKMNAINYFKTESASSIFYYDHVKKNFIRVWMSD